MSRTYLFDFDGTLVDSMPVYGALILGVLAENHIPHDESILKITTPLGYRGAAEYFKTLGMNRTVDEIVDTLTQRAVEAYTYRVEARRMS